MYNSDPAMNMLKLIEIALDNYVDCGEGGLDSSVAKVVRRVEELETALKKIAAMRKIIAFEEFDKGFNDGTFLARQIARTALGSDA